jgi:hypothetical protein
MISGRRPPLSLVRWTASGDPFLLVQRPALSLVAWTAYGASESDSVWCPALSLGLWTASIAADSGMSKLYN